jgi:N-acetylated-alpha-linked acidic dipeptidase
LQSLNGRGDKIDDWTGGLEGEGVQYFVGPGEGEVELVNEMDEAVTPIWVHFVFVVLVFDQRD